jgi:hypothetical protein
METETFLTLAVRLGFLTDAQAVPTMRLITEISKMLTALRSRLIENRQPNPVPCPLQPIFAILPS